MPYSEQACRDAVKALGYTEGASGFPFAADNRRFKGCYAYDSGVYAGSGWYGRGGTVEDMQKELNAGAFRPENYDLCKGNRMYIYINRACMHVCVCMHASIHIYNSA